VPQVAVKEEAAAGLMSCHLKDFQRQKRGAPDKCDNNLIQTWGN